MRPIPVGYQAGLDVVVAAHMVAEFDTLGPVHPVYATFWMARHMEEAGRTMLLPFLDGTEDAVGEAIQVSHRALALPGTRLTVTAAYASTAGSRVVARCTAQAAGGEVVGVGETVQVVMPRAALLERLARLREGGR
jgi:fluoroacetyl-CoA thioesterase